MSSTQAITTIGELPTMTNIENLSVQGAAGVALDTTSITGLTSLTTTKSVAATLTAADTTDVNVSGATGAIKINGAKNITVTDATKDTDITIGDVTAATGTITVTDTKLNNGSLLIDGGTDVTVTTTSDVTTAAPTTAGDIKIGTTTQATGNVVVTQNLNTDGVAAFAGGNIEIKGGKTVDVTVNATTTAKTNTSDNDITIGSVKVTGDSKTTDVTVTQKGTATTKTADKVAQIDAKSVVTFVAMAKNESTTVNGLTFTASKALTAEEVAAAFANLTATDTQTVTGPTSNGIYSGTNATTGAGVTGVAGWTSGAAAGATVTFTNATIAAALNVGDTTATGTVAAVTTAGTAATGGDFATNAVAYSAVTIDDNATEAIKTITLDGFASATLGGAGSLDALTTLNIANNTKDGDVTLTSTSTTLALNVNNITDTGSVVNVGASVNNLTIGATAKASTFDLTAAALKDLTINAAVALDISTNATGYATANLKTVDVNGAGKVNLGDLTTAKLNTFDASGNTGGVTAKIDTATASIGTITDYIFSEGNDVVTLAETAVNTKVTLGAGDDKITLLTGTQTLDKVIDAGTGMDTLAMVAADAVAVTTGATFENKIDGFEKLSITDKVATVSVVNLNNLDDINYVITAGSNVTAGAAATETAKITFVDLLAGQSVTVAGLTLANTTGATITAANVAGAFDSLLVNAITGDAVANSVWSGTLTGWASAAASGNDVTFTSSTANTNVSNLVPTYAGVAAATAIAAGTFAAGNSVGSTEATIALTTNPLLKGQSVTIAGVKVIAQKDLTAAEVSVAFNGTPATSAGNYTVVGSYDTTTIAGMSAGGTVTGAGGTVTITDKSSVYTLTVDPVYTPTVSSLVSAPSALTIVTTDGISTAEAATPLLTISNMANNGTVELVSASDGLVVSMKDATGTADTLNIVTADVATGTNLGKVVANGVETINVTTTDIFTDTAAFGTATDGNGIAIADGKDDANSFATLNVTSDKATTVNVTGAGDLNLTTTSSVLTKVDATNMTGALTYTATVNSVTVNGGQAVDSLTASANDVKLNGGAGNDTLTVSTGADRAILDGGLGNDTFVIAGAASTSSTYANILSVNTGDVIDFTGATSFAATKVTLSTGATETTQALMDLAVSTIATNQMGWFQTGGNTFIVMDTDGNNTFNGAADMAVMITGLVDLSTASFNTAGTLEIA